MGIGVTAAGMAAGLAAATGAVGHGGGGVCWGQVGPFCTGGGPSWARGGLERALGTTQGAALVVVLVVPVEVAVVTAGLGGVAVAVAAGLGALRLRACCCLG